MNRRHFVTLSAGLVAQGAAAAEHPAEDATPVVVSGVEIPCRLSYPKGTPKGRVLLLPGSLFNDVNGDYPAMGLHPHVYLDLARQLGERGFAVLRMAKIGPGTGARSLDPEAAQRHADFRMRVEVAHVALQRLQSLAEGGPLIVAGHSEGAVVASLLATLPDGATSLNGVVSLSGPALPIFGIMREQLEGMRMPAADMAAFDQGIAELRAGRPLSPELARAPSLAPMASMPKMSIDYLVSCDRVDPKAAAAAVRQPMLIVQGERDDSVAPHHAHDLLAARAGKSTQLALLPGLTHMYKVAPPDLTPMQSMGLTSDNDPAVADAIAAWAGRL